MRHPFVILRALLLSSLPLLPCLVQAADNPATSATPAATPTASLAPTAAASAVSAASADSGNTRNLRILALDRILPGAKEERIKTLIPEEAKAILNLYLAGTIQQWWFRQDRPGAVFLLEANSVEDAHRMLAQLPLAREGLVDYDLVPVGPYIPLATLIPPEQPAKPKKKGLFRK